MIDLNYEAAKLEAADALTYIQIIEMFLKNRCSSQKIDLKSAIAYFLAHGNAHMVSMESHKHLCNRLDLLRKNRNELVHTFLAKMANNASDNIDFEPHIDKLAQLRKEAHTCLKELISTYDKND